MDKIFKSLEELNTVEDINAQLDLCNQEKEKLHSMVRDIGSYMDELYTKRAAVAEQDKYSKALEKVGRYFKHVEEDYEACLYVVRCVTRDEMELEDDEPYTLSIICNVVYDAGSEYGSFYGCKVNFYDGDIGVFDYGFGYVDFSVVEECTKEEFTKLKKKFDSKEN